MALFFPKTISFSGKDYQLLGLKALKLVPNHAQIMTKFSKIWHVLEPKIGSSATRDKVLSLAT
jgi:hypothetical protein